MHWSVQDALHKAQLALAGVLDNFPNRFIAGAVRVLLFPFGMPYAEPNDDLGGDVARAMQTAGPSRERLLADGFLADDLRDPVACGELAFALLPQVDAIEHRLKPAVRAGQLEAMPQTLPLLDQWSAHAVSLGLLTPEERRTLADFARFTDLSVHVDDFSPDLNAAVDAEQRRRMTAPAIVLEV